MAHLYGEYLALRAGLWWFQRRPCQPRRGRGCDVHSRPCPAPVDHTGPVGDWLCTGAALVGYTETHRHCVSGHVLWCLGLGSPWVSTAAIPTPSCWRVFLPLRLGLACFKPSRPPERAYGQLFAARGWWVLYPHGTILVDALCMMCGVHLTNCSPMPLVRRHTDERRP